MATTTAASSAWLPRAQVVGASVLFSTAGAAIKACELTGWQVAGVRAAIAGLALIAFLPATRRRFTPRDALVALIYAVTVILFVQANKLTTAANAIFIQSASPLFLVLLGPWLLKEPVRRKDVAFMVALAVGLSLFFVSLDRPAATAPDPGLGNLVAAASCLSVALMLIGLRGLERAGRDGGMPAVVAGNFLAFVVCLPFAWPFTNARAADWLILAFLGVFQIGLGYVLLLRGLRHLTALEAALLLNVEPVLNPLWAWLLHGERPGTAALAGGALILAAVVVRAWHDSRVEPEIASAA
jgi:drug/metabolite transporter (DMT)-like permease